MPIWELTPTDKESDHWRASQYKRRVVVRAPTEDKARRMASSRFHDMSMKVPEADTPLNPWKLPDLVACKPLKNSRYDDLLLNPPVVIKNRGLS